MKNLGFLRAVAAAPAVHIADCEANAAEITAMLEDMRQAEPDLIVFPEMCLTGYTCGDLFHNQTLLDGAINALHSVAKATENIPVLVLAGLPLRVGGALYN